MQIGMLLSVPSGMLRFKSTVQCVLDFQGTLLNLLAVTNVLAESCDFGCNLRFLFSERNLPFRGGTADFVLELGTLAYQGFQLRRDLSRYVFVTECAIRIDKQQK